MPFLTHPSGQKTFYYDDCFADPWTPTETILIHHGFGRNSNFWYKWVPILARKYRVIRRDGLGHGYSSPPPENNPPKNVDAVLDDLVDTLNQLKIDKVHWLGESTGGIFGELFAIRFPERLHSLAICGSPLGFGPPGQKLMAFGYPSVNDAIRGLGVRGWGEETFKTVNTGPDVVYPDGFKSWWIGEWGRSSAEGVSAYSDVICRKEFDCEPNMDKIKAPMLILSPGGSPLVNVDDQKRLAKVTGGQLEIVPTNVHEIYLLEAEMCQDKYLKFLSNLK